MVEGNSAEKFSSLRSDDCQAFFMKAFIPVPFASSERRFQMMAPRYAIEFFINGTTCAQNAWFGIEISPTGSLSFNLFTFMMVALLSNLYLHTMQ